MILWVFLDLHKGDGEVPSRGVKAWNKNEGVGEGTRTWKWTKNKKREQKVKNKIWKAIIGSKE